MGSIFLAFAHEAKATKRVNPDSRISQAINILLTKVKVGKKYK
jgi:hypothetical protein